MNASHYKDFVLVLLFMKYISDRYEGKEDELIEIPKGVSYREGWINDKGSLTQKTGQVIV
jgi:type I restriction-modification system DNA methylase subunit